MLDTNQTCGPPLEYGFKASVTIRGPWREVAVRLSLLYICTYKKDRKDIYKSGAYQVRATNPNIDHISYSFSSVAFPFTTTDFLMWG